MKMKLRMTQNILYIKNKLVQLYKTMISLKTAMIANILAQLSNQVN